MTSTTPQSTEHYERPKTKAEYRVFVSAMRTAMQVASKASAQHAKTMMEIYAMQEAAVGIAQSDELAGDVGDALVDATDFGGTVNRQDIENFLAEHGLDHNDLPEK